MTLNELVAEGEKLARPSWILGTHPTQSGIVGYWSGERADRPNALEPEVTAYRSNRHILSMSEQILDEMAIGRGPVSLFQLESVKDRELLYSVHADSRLHFKDLRFDGEPLYATCDQSFPPFPAVCLYGSEAVGAWLAKQGLSRHDYWRVTDDLERDYTAEWMRRSALYRSAGDVIVGGWHFIWPEDDFYAPPEMQLVALTLRDAEPWLEVWYSRPRLGFYVRERIT